MFPSSVEEGKLWPKAMAGVVRPARVPTTPRWLPPALPLLIQRGELFLVLMSPCITDLLLNQIETHLVAEEFDSLTCEDSVLDTVVGAPVIMIPRTFPPAPALCLRIQPMYRKS